MAKQYLGRLFILAGLIILTALFSWQAFGADAQIVEVRKNITLSDQDPSYRDYYIQNIKSGSRVKDVVRAVRKTSIRDPRAGQILGEMIIPIGQLRIIAIQGNIAVAREVNLISRESQPLVDQYGIMVGDLIEAD